MKITRITTHVMNMPLNLDGDVPHAEVQARTALEMLLCASTPMRVSPPGVKASRTASGLRRAPR
jgi:hypothetical protein